MKNRYHTLVIGTGCAGFNAADRLYGLGVKDIAICQLTSADVVRHALVQQIINAYEKAAQKQEVKKPSQKYRGQYQRKK